MPKTYRVIMYTVQAIQVLPADVDRAALWCGGVKIEEYDAVDSSRKFVALNIPTINGVERASEGDYVMKTRDGGFRAVPKREFESKYELAQQ
jgi:hypothetical protein